MKNNGDGTFTNITFGSGWDLFTGLSIEYVSYDFNNDGFADVFTNGYIMYNNGDFTFTPIQVPMGVAAIGDLNNDGFLDVQVGNNIYFSSGNSNNWIKLNLEGVQSNRNGIGARVEIYGSWGKQIRDVQAGIGFRHMGTLNVQFGIGTENSIDSIIVKWPSGLKDVICSPSINTNFFIKEGSGALPNSEFTVNSNTINTGESVSVSDLTSNCPIDWNYAISPSTGWEFINGTTVSSQNPEIQFNNPGTYTLSLIASNSNGQSLNSDSEVINVLSTNGVNELNFKEISIYPNPNNQNVLSVSLNKEVNKGSISMFNLQGQLISSQAIVAENGTKHFTLNVEHLGTGVYFIEFNFNGNKEVKRLVKL
jgi:PKD repeat protein